MKEIYSPKEIESSLDVRTARKEPAINTWSFGRGRGGGGSGGQERSDCHKRSSYSHLTFVQVFVLDLDFVTSLLLLLFPLCPAASSLCHFFSVCQPLRMLVVCVLFYFLKRWMQSFHLHHFFLYLARKETTTREGEQKNAKKTRNNLLRTPNKAVFTALHCQITPI